MIKKYIILLMSSVFLFSSCLKEDPPFDNYKVINTSEGLQTSTNGVYGSLAAPRYFASDYFAVANLNSGMITSGSVADQGTISALNLAPNQKNVENLWAGMYTTINRVNNIVDVWVDKEEKGEEITMADHLELAQNYFIRSFTYFNLVRFWGKVPLKLHTSSVESLNQPRAPRADVYAQIIKDANKAIDEYNKGGNVPIKGRPSVEAVHMLLAKVYLTMSTADVDNDILNQKSVFDNKELSDLDEHQVLVLAKEHAEAADKGYKLVQNYNDLWLESNGNTEESIFEIQFNVENPFEGRLWNIKNSYKGRAGWGRMNINAEVIDRFIDSNIDTTKYASGKLTDASGRKYLDGDPRYYSIFRSHYIDFSKPQGKQYMQTYPEKKIGGNPKTFPSAYKYAIKNLDQTSVSTNQNMIIYRYAGLKLLMAEIGIRLGENVGGKSPVDHVNDVLARARNSEIKPFYDKQGHLLTPENDDKYPQDLTSIDLDEIYNQYTYELLTEGEDWFRNRRQGRVWFKEHIIDPHNEGIEVHGHMINHSNDDFFIVYPTGLDNEVARAMLLPIPITEINTNSAIGNKDQNFGY